MYKCIIWVPSQLYMWNRTPSCPSSNIAFVCGSMGGDSIQTAVNKRYYKFLQHNLSHYKMHVSHKSLFGLLSVQKRKLLNFYWVSGSSYPTPIKSCYYVYMVLKLIKDKINFVVLLDTLQHIFKQSSSSYERKKAQDDVQRQ